MGPAIHVEQAERNRPQNGPAVLSRDRIARDHARSDFRLADLRKRPPDEGGRARARQPLRLRRLSFRGRPVGHSEREPRLLGAIPVAGLPARERIEHRHREGRVLFQGQIGQPIGLPVSLEGLCPLARRELDVAGERVQVGLARIEFDCPGNPPAGVWIVLIFRPGGCGLDERFHRFFLQLVRALPDPRAAAARPGRGPRVQLMRLEHLSGARPGLAARD